MKTINKINEITSEPTLYSYALMTSVEGVFKLNGDSNPSRRFITFGCVNYPGVYTTLVVNGGYIEPIAQVRWNGSYFFKTDETVSMTVDFL